jgi:tRNA U34 2-thiouridine synthase MnmA/TrmU
MATHRAKAIGMLSGGLDSTLAHALLAAQGIEVKANNFYTGFCITETQRRMGRTRADGSAPRNDALHAAANLDTDIELVDASGPDYLEVITKPRYGYGANANPCVDCRIYMFHGARKIMEREGADFVFTGEVLGQRPKSQRRDTMRAIERDSGLTGRLLRPLSAKLLEPTIPEQDGLVDREKLLAISGRSRKAQMALAEELRIGDYPTPAGGCCFLTDETFGRRFHDLVDRRADRRLGQEEVPLLATGRHFRLSNEAKLIVGRDEGENELLSRFANDGHYRVSALDVVGPMALVEGEPSSEEREVASRIVARYGKGRDLEVVRVEWQRGASIRVVVPVMPYRDDGAFDRLRI